MTAARTAYSSPDRLADCVNQVIFVGKLARLELGIQRLATHGELEAASAGRNHHETTDGALVTRQELGRQTDGLRLVVSKCTVFERDIHFGSPYPCRRSPARPDCPDASCASVIIVSSRPARKTCQWPFPAQHESESLTFPNHAPGKTVCRATPPSDQPKPHSTCSPPRRSPMRWSER